MADDELNGVVRSMLERGESQDAINAAVASYKPPSKSDATEQAFKAQHPSAAWFANDPFEGRPKPTLTSIAKKTTDALPLLAGGAGAIAAGPLGAAAGGAAGTATKNAINAGTGWGPTPTSAAGNAADVVKGGVTQGALDGAATGIGAGLKKMAPYLMDVGLWRTTPQRMEFENTPQRLVDEGIIPTYKNVRGAMTKTEAQVMADARAADRARPPVAGYLPAATETTTPPPIQLEGPEPVPSGGRPAMSTPAPIPQRGRIESSDDYARRIMEWANTRHIDTSGVMRDGARTDFPNRLDPQQLSGEVVRQGTPDVVEGRGVMVQPDVTRTLDAPGRGAPESMVDPRRIADMAAEFARKEGRVPALGNVPGPEEAEIQGLRNKYLSENTRPRNIEETIDQKRAFQQRGSYAVKENATPSSNEQRNFNTGAAAANRSEAIRLVPSLEGGLTKEQDLLGALVALQRTEARTVPATFAGGVRHVLAGPRVMGGAAIAADRAGQAMQNSATPQALRAALLQLMSSHGQGEQ